MGGKPEPSLMFWSFAVAQRDASVAVVQAVVEGHGWRVGGLAPAYRMEVLLLRLCELMMTMLRKLVVDLALSAAPD
jgi:hypothetical protein